MSDTDDWTSGWEIVPEGDRAVARVLPRPPCLRCAGSGLREVGYGGERRVARCRCQMLPDRVALFNRARIPARHASNSMESFRSDAPGANTMCFVLARRWLDAYRVGEENRGLVMYGEPGRGKTHLAVAIVRELVFRHGVNAGFVEFTHLLASIREGIGRDDPTATSLEPYVAPQVLVIDELAKGRRTEWEVSILDELVSRRYNAGRTLIATTNFPLRAPPRRPNDPATLVESLPERLGPRIMSRLKETVAWAEAQGEDYRTTRGK
jgi:DNA replication protein DnaC